MYESSPTRTGISLGPGPAVVACDVGGTTVKLALVGADGRLGAVSRIPTPRGPSAPAAILELVRDALDVARRTHDVAAVGLSVPGLVDDAGGVAIAASNFEWNEVPF